MIFEKIKLEEEPLSTYKTTAHITFSNATVFKGVIELDSKYLQVRQGFSTSPRKAEPKRIGDLGITGSDLSFVIDNDAAEGPLDAKTDEDL